MLLAPVVVGWLRLSAERHGLVDAPNGIALSIVMFIGALSVVAYRGAVAVSRSSAELMDREGRLRLAHEAARIGAFDWNILQDRNTWTTQLEAIHGLPGGSFGNTRRDWQALVHPEDRPAMAQAINQALLAGEPVEGEWRVIWPDETVHWIACRWRVLRDPSGAPTRMVGVSMDVTEPRMMRGALEATIQKLERSNKELEEFAYICVHDLQEPMRQIQLFVQLLKSSGAAWTGRPRNTSDTFSMPPRE